MQNYYLLLAITYCGGSMGKIVIILGMKGQTHQNELQYDSMNWKPFFDRLCDNFMLFICKKHKIELIIVYSFNSNFDAHPQKLLQKLKNAYLSVRSIWKYETLGGWNSIYCFLLSFVRWMFVFFFISYFSLIYL